MSKQQKSADQTEKPTPKRLRDARKEGEVHRSQELSSTMVVLLWVVIASLGGGYLYQRIASGFEALFDQIQQASDAPSTAGLVNAGLSAGTLLLSAVLPLMIATALVGLAIEFLQVGALFAPKRMVPDISRLNPVEGIKRMFTQENLVEVVKALVKCSALIGIVILLLWRMLPDVLRLPMGQPPDLLQALSKGVMWIGVWTIFVFFFVSALDVAYQRFVFTKNLRMSKRDIRDEMKNTEGDPLMKNRRRQLHQEWSQQNMLSAVRRANVVVTNPTHVAVALMYEPGETDLPVVVAKGEDYEAGLIREAAREAGVPILQNIDLARGLNEKIALDDYISAEFFEAVAEVLRWAESLKTLR